MKRKEVKKVGDLLYHFLKANGLERGYAEYRLKKAWGELLGIPVARRTSSLTIRNRKLFVTLHSSVMRQELDMIKDTLVPRLNEAAGMDVIDELVLR